MTRYSIAMALSAGMLVLGLMPTSSLAVPSGLKDIAEDPSTSPLWVLAIMNLVTDLAIMGSLAITAITSASCPTITPRRTPVIPTVGPVAIAIITITTMATVTTKTLRCAVNHAGRAGDRAVSAGSA